MKLLKQVHYEEDYYLECLKVCLEKSLTKVEFPRRY